MTRKIDMLRVSLQRHGLLEAQRLRNPSLFSLWLFAPLAAFSAGLLLFRIDPNIHSVFDGTGYAWVTMTHVGYDDVLPVSFARSLLAASLSVFGFCLFAFFHRTPIGQTDDDARPRVDSLSLVDLGFCQFIPATKTAVENSMTIGSNSAPIGRPQAHRINGLTRSSRGYRARTT